MTDFDEVDRAILTELQRDGRMSNTDLAALVDLSPSAALRRTRALERAGVIERYVALLDPALIGRSTTAFVEITLDKQSNAHLDEFEAAVARGPEVVSCHLMAGDADYLLQLVCADVQDFERVHRDWLSRLPGVARIRSSFALRAVCQRTAFDL